MAWGRPQLTVVPWHVRWLCCVASYMLDGDEGQLWSPSTDVLARVDEAASGHGSDDDLDTSGADHIDDANDRQYVLLVCCYLARCVCVGLHQQPRRGVLGLWHSGAACLSMPQPAAKWWWHIPLMSTPSSTRPRMLPLASKPASRCCFYHCAVGRPGMPACPSALCSGHLGHPRPLACVTLTALPATVIATMATPPRGGCWAC